MLVKLLCPLLMYIYILYHTFLYYTGVLSINGPESIIEPLTGTSRYTINVTFTLDPLLKLLQGEIGNNLNVGALLNYVTLNVEIADRGGNASMLS